MKDAGAVEQRVTWLLGYARLWSEDGTFTFPDGETWHTHEEPGTCTVEEGRCVCEMEEVDR